MEAAYVLLEGPLPRDRHRQEESIETCINESLTDVAARCHDQPSLGVRNRRQSFCGRAALLFSHVTFSRKICDWPLLLTASRGTGGALCCQSEEVGNAPPGSFARHR